MLVFWQWINFFSRKYSEKKNRQDDDLVLFKKFCNTLENGLRDLHIPSHISSQLPGSTAGPVPPQSSACSKTSAQKLIHYNVGSGSSKTNAKKLCTKLLAMRKFIPKAWSRLLIHEISSNYSPLRFPKVGLDSCLLYFIYLFICSFIWYISRSCNDIATQKN